MASAARSIREVAPFDLDSKEVLRGQWNARHRLPGDFDRLWDLYWAELGPLAAVPGDIHQLEEVLVR